MTLSPSVDRRVKARIDLPAYPLNQSCPREGTRAVDNHHLWRRSIAPSFREAWWVELSDGTVLPNRIGVSTSAHQKLTENKAWIRWLGEDEGFAWLEKNDQDEWELLSYIDYLPTFKEEPDAA